MNRSCQFTSFSSATSSALFLFAMLLETSGAIGATTSTSLPTETPPLLDQKPSSNEHLEAAARSRAEAERLIEGLTSDDPTDIVVQADLQQIDQSLEQARLSIESAKVHLQDAAAQRKINEEQARLRQALVKLNAKKNRQRNWQITQSFLSKRLSVETSISFSGGMAILTARDALADSALTLGIVPRLALGHRFGLLTASAEGALIVSNIDNNLVAAHRGGRVDWRLGILLRYDMNLGRRWLFTPGVAVGGGVVSRGNYATVNFPDEREQFPARSSIYTALSLLINHVVIHSATSEGPRAAKRLNDATSAYELLCLEQGASAKPDCIRYRRTIEAALLALHSPVENCSTLPRPFSDQPWTLDDTLSLRRIAECELEQLVDPPQTTAWGLDPRLEYSYSEYLQQWTGSIGILARF